MRCLPCFSRARPDTRFYEAVTEAASRVLSLLSPEECGVTGPRPFRAVHSALLKREDRGTAWFAGACRVGVMLALRVVPPHLVKPVLNQMFCRGDDTPLLPGLQLDDTVLDEAWHWHSADSLEARYGADPDVVLFCSMVHCALWQLVVHGDALWLPARRSLPFDVQPAPLVELDSALRPLAARSALSMLSAEYAEAFGVRQRFAARVLPHARCSPTHVCYEDRAQPLGVQAPGDPVAPSTYSGFKKVWDAYVAERSCSWPSLEDPEVCI